MKKENKLTAKELRAELLEYIFSCQYSDICAVTLHHKFIAYESKLCEEQRELCADRVYSDPHLDVKNSPMPEL